MTLTTAFRPALFPFGERHRLLIVLCILLLAPLPVTASELSERMSISGFLSFGGGLTDAEPYPGGENPNDPEDQPNPYGETPKYTAGSARFIYDDRLSFKQDTRAGLQINFNIDEKTSAVLQYTSRGSLDNFDSVLSWANATYSLRPDLTLRGGRFALPIYLASDHLDVGLALPWIRPPVEVYTTVNLTNLTGADLLYARQLGEWVLQAQLFLGTSELKREDFVAEFKNLYGFNSSLIGDNGTLRIAYMEYDYFITPWPLGEPHRQLIQALLALGMNDIEAYLDPNGRGVEFFSVGFNWQIQQWGAQGEWVKRNQATVTPDVDAYYLTLHYEYKNWRPHVTFAARRERNENKRFHPDMAQLTVISPQVAELTENSVHAITGIEDNESKSITLGLNYTISNSMIGRFEVAEIENIESTGFFEFATKNKKNHLASFVIDMTF